MTSLHPIKSLENRRPPYRLDNLSPGETWPKKKFENSRKNQQSRPVCSSGKEHFSRRSTNDPYVRRQITNYAETNAPYNTDKNEKVSSWSTTQSEIGVFKQKLSL